MVSGMGGRRDDSAPGRSALPPVPPVPPAARRAPAPPPAWIDEPDGREPDTAPGVAAEEDAPDRRIWLVVGLALTAGATTAAFFTENPLYLRVALLAVCWAFVIAAFVAGNRRGDRAAAAGREAELRHAYELEL